MSKAIFPQLKPIKFEGKDSDNPLAFRYYDAKALVGKKTMAEHLRFAMAYWHSFGGSGADPFGAPTISFPWNKGKTAKDRARRKLDGAFEIMQILGMPFYCWHDYDLIEEAESLSKTEARLKDATEHALELQKSSGIQLLWGTANLFSHPRYMNGAATNPDFAVLAHAAAQVKMALDATVALGGQSYVFWGGREGYLSLLNTDMARERQHLASFLKMARDYGRSIGFKGQFLIEPKPMEPTKHQYDYDAATVIGFLKEFDLQADFKLNLEVNHATLAGHSFEHELQVAADAGMLGSIDANRGDYQNGWDTDQFPNDPVEMALAMRVILKSGGLAPGGINFDAKIRRNSVDPMDLIYAHIGGMDAFARGLLAAHAIMKDGGLEKNLKDRYSSFDSGSGQKFEAGKLSLKQLANLAEKQGDIKSRSGRQEYLENYVMRFI